METNMGYTKMKVRHEKYWDNFEERINQTVDAMIKGSNPLLGRIALHITSRCNFKCDYCNEHLNNSVLPMSLFLKIVNEYSQMGGGILHITGGEPTAVKWLDEAIQNTSENVTINLNTNCYRLLKRKTYEFIDRIKVSLDTSNREYFDNLVHCSGAFDRIVANLWKLSEYNKTKDVSITFTLTRENFREVPEFLSWYYRKLSRVYAIFFSIYKGTDERFLFREDDQIAFWDDVVPKMKQVFKENDDKESLWLFEHSYNQNTLSTSCRYPENIEVPCHISKSELTINEEGNVWRCSHLFRDKVPCSSYNIKNESLEYIHNNLIQIKYSQCLIGCNLKLIHFNQEVQEGLGY